MLFPYFFPGFARRVELFLLDIPGYPDVLCLHKTPWSEKEILFLATAGRYEYNTKGELNILILNCDIPLLLVAQCKLVSSSPSVSVFHFHPLMGRYMIP